MTFIDWLLSRKKKYYCYFVIKEQNGYNRIAKKRFNPTKPQIKYAGKMFEIDVNGYAFSYIKKNFYFIDLYDDQQLTFESLSSRLDSGLIDMIMNKKIVEQLAVQLSTASYKLLLGALAVGGLIGGLIGYIIAISS